VRLETMMLTAILIGEMICSQCACSLLHPSTMQHAPTFSRHGERNQRTHTHLITRQEFTATNPAFLA
jgi:hypothetical protein